VTGGWKLEAEDKTFTSLDRAAKHALRARLWSVDRSPHAT